MNQQETIKVLKDNLTQARQLNVMLGVADKAFRDNMHSYCKMVQMDAIRKFDAHCDEDGVGGERVRFLYDTMDPIMGQLNDDLEKQIMGQFEKLKASVTGQDCGAQDSGADSKQQENIEALKENPRMAKQVAVMLGIIEDAFKDNITAFIRLVHFDVMSDFDARCDKDGVGGERVQFSHGAMDPMMRQVNDDLKKQISERFAGLRELLQ